MARSMLPGRSLDSGSNVGARGMITLSGSSGETELGLQTRFRIFFLFPFCSCIGNYKNLSPQKTQSQIIQKTELEKVRLFLSISSLIVLCVLCALGG